MQPKEKGIVYDFAKLCLNIMTSEDLATRKCFFTMRTTCSMVLVHKARQMSCRGSQESVVLYIWEGLLPPNGTQRYLIPKPSPQDFDRNLMKS